MNHLVSRSFLLCALVACGTVREAPDGAVGDDVPADASAVDAAPDAMPGDPSLDVTVGGTATGTVQSLPDGIDCPGTCRASFAPGTVVTLVARPDAGAELLEWGGACSGSETTCVVTLEADTVVTATFIVAAYQVSLVVGGNGDGRVTSDVGGLDCPGACNANLTHGTTLTLTATPEPGSTFLGWSGGGCDGTDPCTLTVAGLTEVHASFGLQHSVVVTRTGNGEGTVTSNPAGISCGSDCDQVYSAGTTVTLDAAPAVGSTFEGWANGCTGPGSCAVTVDASIVVSAEFKLKRYPLSVSLGGSGGGVVTSAPVGIQCPGDCSQQYDHGTSVVLTPVADALSTFAGWSGACSGMGSCTVAMTQARSVTATFNVQTFQVDVTRAGNGAGTVTAVPAGINCGTDCTGIYAAGTSVTLTASAPPGSIFVGWSGGPCSGSASACAFTVGSDVDVTATFDLAFVVEAEYGVTGGGAPVALGPIANRACFLSAVSGQFFGAHRSARVYVEAGQWYLHSTPYVDAAAQCIAWSPSAQMSVDLEGDWEQGEAPFALGAAANRMCGLTRMAGYFNGGGEEIRTRVEGGTWWLDGMSLAHGVSAGARCLTWGPAAQLAQTGEYGWYQGFPEAELGAVGTRMCVFTMIAGRYLGGGEFTYVRRFGSTWRLGGGSAQEGVSSRARCLEPQ